MKCLATTRSPKRALPGLNSAPTVTSLRNQVHPSPDTCSNANPISGQLRGLDGPPRYQRMTVHPLESRAPEEAPRTTGTPSILKRVLSVRVRPLTSQSEEALQHRKHLRGASEVVLGVLRNSLGCLVCAWVANLCYSLGDVLSLRPSRDQSTESLIVASLVWTNVLYCIIISLTQTAILAPLRFVSNPDAPAGVLFAMKKLVKATPHYYFASVLLIAVLGVLIGNFMPATLRWFKLEFYLGAFVNHLYTTGVEHATRRIYREETCKGQERGRQHRENNNDTSQGVLAVPDAPRPRRCSERPMPSYLRLYLKSTPKVLITVLVGTYVQVASRTHFMNSGAELLAFTAVSLALKILIQKLAKVYVMRRGIQQMRFMCVLLGLPTVLIDTQVRVVMLLGGQSSDFAKVGSVAMATCEISMRIWKMWLVKSQTRRRGQTIQRAANVLMSRNSNQHTGVSTRREPTTSLSEFERWKRQMLDFHTAEIMADMYAKYIVISCSVSILFFFANHPKYMYADTSSVGGSSATTSGSSDTAGGDDVVSGSLSSLTYSHFKLIGFQVALEIVVDYVACTYEIASGTLFASVRKFSSFLAFLFMTIAVVDINMPSFLYLK